MEERVGQRGRRDDVARLEGDRAFDEVLELADVSRPCVRLEKAQGLMFRESMPKNAGMVFPFDGLEIRPFWMKNCHFPLDLVYATKDGTVVEVIKALPPCPPDPAPCPNTAPKEKSDTVLEVNAGVADAQGAIPGAKLTFLSIPGR